MEERKSNIGVYREIEKMDDETLMSNALYWFRARISPDNKISQVFKRALVVHGLVTEKGADLLEEKIKIILKPSKS